MRPIGYKVSEETKRKISETRRALKLKPDPYQRNPNSIIECLECKKSFEVVFSRRNTAKFCSKKCHNKHMSGRKAYNKGVFKSKSYGACHYKVRKIRGTPSKCEICRIEKIRMG